MNGWHLNKQAVLDLALQQTTWNRSFLLFPPSPVLPTVFTANAKRTDITLTKCAYHTLLAACSPQPHTSDRQQTALTTESKQHWPSAHTLLAACSSQHTKLTVSKQHWPSVHTLLAARNHTTVTVSKLWPSAHTLLAACSPQHTTLTVSKLWPSSHTLLAACSSQAHRSDRQQTLTKCAYLARTLQHATTQQWPSANSTDHWEQTELAGPLAGPGDSDGATGQRSGQLAVIAGQRGRHSAPSCTLLPEIKPPPPSPPLHPLTSGGCPEPSKVPSFVSL